MELCSLHPFSGDDAAAYVSHWAASRQPGGDGELAPRLSGRASMALTAGFAQELLLCRPAFTADGLCLTSWEARIDRGMAMLIRPPSRLFQDAGLPGAVVRAMPIRLDLDEGRMGGGYVPARLVPQALETLHRNMRRSLRRMTEAELDAVHLQCLMIEAFRFARDQQLGIFEAIGIVDFADPRTWPGGSDVRNQARDKSLFVEVTEAAKPEPKPGFLASRRRRFWRADRER